MKRLISILAALCLLALSPAVPAGAETVELVGRVVTTVEKIDSAFGKADWKALRDLDVDAEIILNGAEGTVISGRSSQTGSVLTLTGKGVYHVTGRGENMQIVVNDAAKSGNVTLILDEVTLTNAEAPVLVVESADKVILWVTGDCALACGAADSALGAAVYARDTLTVAGDGTLAVTAGQDGFVCKDNYRQTGADVTIDAAGAGLNVNDSVRIGGGTLSITSGKDGIHLSNSKLDSWFYLENGAVSITAGQDGIDVSGEEDSFSGFMTLYGGSLTVSSGAGPTAHRWGSDISTKGLKCQGDIYIGAVTLSVSSEDDAIHSDASVSVTGGILTLASGDDGIHAGSALSVSGGRLLVSQSHEGLEAWQIDLSGGEINVYAADDGLNAAGGSDTTSQETEFWGRRGGWDPSSGTGVLNISGGTVYVNAEGDGLDSNGSLYVTGGLVIVEGPTNGGNGALDRGDAFGSVASITGGTVLALGSTGMAANFDAGTQCSALVSLSGGPGTVVSAGDGSGFTFTASKAFACAVYSSPALREGSVYPLTAGEQSAEMDFTAGRYFSDVTGGFGGGHGPGGWGPGGPGSPGGPGGGPGMPGGGHGGRGGH